MCGFIISNIGFETNLLSNILKHRGPDDTSLYSDKYVKILFNRLSIIDINPRSNQPFKKDENIIIFNGEIYNYLELRNILKKKGYQFKTKSDTEVLLISYLEWGEDCLEKFEGMFAFCIYNLEKKSIFAARDRFGIKPLFIYRNQNNFILSSEKKAIFKFFVKKEINISKVSNYLAHGVYQHNNQTFYKNIFHLEPGNFLKINKNNFSIKKWHQIKISKLKIDFKEAQIELKKKIQNSINLCLRSDKKISVALSGGLDSSTIAYFINKSEGKKIIENKLVHWTCNGENDEVEFAKNISKSIDKKLIISKFSEKDFFNYLKKAIISVEEPFGGLNNISAMKMFEKLNQKKIRVIIDGNGADEILGGYKQHINAYNKNYLNYFIQPIQGISVNFYKNILSKKYKNEIEQFKIKKIFNNPLKDSMYNDLAGSKLRRSLFQQDHLAMRSSLEMRFPFLNNELVNFCYSLPGSFLVRKNLGKYILRKILNNQNSMTKKRPLQNPQIFWMRKFIVDDLISQIETNEKINDFGIFNIPNVVSRLKYWKKHTKNNSVFPWQILMIVSFLKFNF